MGISAKFGSGSIREQVVAFRERLDAAVVLMLQYLGESLVNYAKENHNYTDRTGNLTNSMGYAVVHDGMIVCYGGDIQPGDGASEGLKTARKMAEDAGSTFSLLVVAGMNYAAYVESKGYNVILPAELKARTDFPAAMKKLKEMAKIKAIEQFGKLS